MVVLIEAAPSLILGVTVIWYLNNICSARWLNEEEKQLLERNIARENSTKAESHMTLRALARTCGKKGWLRICFALSWANMA